MKVPQADLHTQYLQIKPEVDAAIGEILNTSQFILGKAVAGFERAFADLHQTKHCVAVGSGTEALHVPLWALGVGPGDGVATVPFTFIATLEAVSLLGATPFLVDIDPKSYTMDPDKLGALLRSPQGKKIKAVMPVHLYGQTAAMDEIRSLAAAHGVPIVEDACQAHLARYKGAYVGNLGAAAGFSFYPGKNLGAYGEAGGILTNDDALAQRMRHLRDHGQVEKYRHAFWGHNYRMDGIQGAVLGVKLPKLAAWTRRRQAVAGLYRAALSNVGDLVMPFEAPSCEHVYHLFVVRTKRRAELQKFLADREIATAVAYPIPLHLQEAYRDLGYKRGDFPASEQAAEEVLALPMFAELTDVQVAFVIDSVRSFFGA
jgi:dTDP-4-amino-4,6-dideoxygalactose transaminase